MIPDLGFKYENLKARIKFYFKNFREFAKATGYTESTISKKLSGRLFITQADIVEWSKMLRIPKSEFGKYYFN